MPSPGRGARWIALTHEAKRVYDPTCHLCSRPIDLTLPGTDRMGWTLDHLDPIGVVGTGLPTIDRVRPAHKSCNSRRGKRPVNAEPRSRTW